MLRVAIALLVLLVPSITQAEQRLSLIGNQSYSTEIGRLSNPHNDVALLETALKGLGFDVVTMRDAGLATLQCVRAPPAGGIANWCRVRSGVVAGLQAQGNAPRAYAIIDISEVTNSEVLGVLPLCCRE